MADINITCPSCGKSCTVSEFVAAETLACPACSGRLQLPNADHGPRLKVRKMTSDEGSTLTSEHAISPLISEARISDQPLSTIGNAHKVRGTIKGPARFLSFLLFLVLAGLFVGAQYFIQQQGAQYLVLYQRISWGVYALLYFLVLLVAAEDSYLQAILCFLLPFYVVYYAFTRMESLLLRGAFMAVIVSLGAEIYFLKNAALLMLAQEQMNQLIEGGSNLIQRAGEAPIQ